MGLGKKSGGKINSIPLSETTSPRGPSNNTISAQRLVFPAVERIYVFYNVPIEEMAAQRTESNETIKDFSIKIKHSGDLFWV